MSVTFQGDRPRFTGVNHAPSKENRRTAQPPWIRWNATRSRATGAITGVNIRYFFSHDEKYTVHADLSGKVPKISLHPDHGTKKAPGGIKNYHLEDLIDIGKNPYTHSAIRKAFNPTGKNRTKAALARRELKRLAGAACAIRAGRAVNAWGEPLKYKQEKIIDPAHKDRPPLRCPSTPSTKPPPAKPHKAGGRARCPPGMRCI